MYFYNGHFTVIKQKKQAEFSIVVSRFYGYTKHVNKKHYRCKDRGKIWRLKMSKNQYLKINY